MICFCVLFTIIGMDKSKKYLIVGTILLVIIIVFAVLFSRVNKSDAPIEELPAGPISECQQVSGSYVGLSEQDAINKAKQDGLTYRVTERDGEGLAATMDYSANRINFAITNGKVKSANCG